MLEYENTWKIEYGNGPPLQVRHLEKNDCAVLKEMYGNANYADMRAKCPSDVILSLPVICTPNDHIVAFPFIAGNHRQLAALGISFQFQPSFDLIEDELVFQ